MRPTLLLSLAIVLGLPLGSQAQPKSPKLPQGTREYLNLAYDKHERNKLDLYVPAGEGPFPLVIWVHGGGWEAGSKEGAGPAIRQLYRGYAVASVNYRYSQQAPFPAQIVDVKAAVRYLKENAKKYQLNPKSVGVWGGSAGGHLVALLGTSATIKAFDNMVSPEQSSEVQCVVDWFGPTDITALVGNRTAPPVIKKLLGGELTDKADVAKLANPITHLSKSAAPFLIIHGDKDPLVPLSQSELLHNALKKEGVPSELIVIKGGGHGGKDFTGEAQQKIVDAFFDKHLKKK